MRLGGNTSYLIEIHNKNELSQALDWAKQKSLPYLVVGNGNNIIWKDEGFNGVVLVNKILGIESKQLDSNRISIDLGAGENWDKVVEKFTKEGFSGIECLSLIPGTCGASPIQNIGAYGGDISNVLNSVEAFDIFTNKFVTLSCEECELGYRASRFKYRDKNRFIIVSINLIIEKKNPSAPYYKIVEEYFKTNDITEITPIVLRDAVVAIRTSKLPDPNFIPNTGSFFANPIIDKSSFDNLHQKFPELVFWLDQDNKVKLSAGWLIEQIGYKDKYDPITGMATWSKHTLTLVNKSAKSTADLLDFKQQIVSRVKDKFDITLEQEPELLP